MKKVVLFTLALAFAAVSVNAQNRWFVSGSIGADYTKIKDVKPATTTFNITPSIHYMFNENWAVGLGLGYGYSKMGVNTGTVAAPVISDRTTNSFSVAPSLIYFMRLGDKFYYTPELTINYTNASAKIKGVAGKTESNTFGAAIAPLSFEFRPTNCIGLNVSAGTLGFNSDKVKNGPTTSDLTLNLNTDFRFAFRFYF